MLSQAPEECQFGVGEAQQGRVVTRWRMALFKPLLSDPLIELVVAQIGCNVNALQFGFCVLNGQGGFV